MDVEPPSNPLLLSRVNPERRQDGSIAEQREAMIERDLNDVYLLIDHLSGRSDRSISELTILNPDDTAHPLNLVDEVCKIGWAQSPERPTTAREAAILFKARDKLNQMANPASGATIAYTILVLAGHEEGLRGSVKSDRPPELSYSRTDLARAAYPKLVKSAGGFRVWITLLQLMLLIGLAATSLLSWNVASGKLIMERIALLDGQAVEVGRTLNAMRIPAALGTPAAPIGSDVPEGSSLIFSLPAYSGACYHKSDAGQPQIEAVVLLQQACATAKQILHNRSNADRDLDEWTSYWGWLKRAAAWLRGSHSDAYDVVQLSWPSERPEVARGMAMEQWAAHLITVLGNFVLPMLYSFLGATTAVVLSIRGKLRESRLAAREMRMSQMQLVLGVIIGACIGLFMSPSVPELVTTAAVPGGYVMGSSSSVLSASALSFLAGFGVDTVFRKLQLILQATFGGQTEQPMADPVQAAQRHYPQSRGTPEAPPRRG